MTDSEGKALNIVLLSKKVYTKATTLNTGSWRSLATSVWRAKAWAADGSYGGNVRSSLCESTRVADNISWDISPLFENRESHIMNHTMLM